MDSNWDALEEDFPYELNVALWIIVSFVDPNILQHRILRCFQIKMKKDPEERSYLHQYSKQSIPTM